MKRLIVSVTNDLTSDQRVHKVCTTLQNMGFDVLLIGRHLKNSKPLMRSYQTKRMKLWFTKGFLFYAEYNFRLFLWLLFQKKDILLSNDLDTLLPNFLISKLFNKPLVYDSHELFTEVPELTSRPQIQKVWLSIERFIFPKLKHVYTVNQSIASIYTKKYKVPVKIIRNIAPAFTGKSLNKSFLEKVKGTKKMLILQGSGINIDRGAEEAVQMMSHLDGCILYIIGSGDVFKTLKKMGTDLALTDKVVIKDKIPYNELMQYTQAADLGLSLDKGTNLNYEYSLPNKVFDYIQAQTPLLVSNRKEVAKLVLKNNIGEVTETLSPKKMAKQIESLLANADLQKTWQSNLKKAAKKYTWENESKSLILIFKALA
ncbi:MAG: glycosyltransferase [Flavobacteriaceae bacterium]|nr:glycosyltransferase [Flavobacteriaceae bacterium]